MIVPVYDSRFFFRKGYGANDNIRGGEKVGKWFTAPSFRNRQYPLSLDSTELGDWLSYFQIAISICRGVKKCTRWGWPTPIFRTIMCW
ncbi:hypothetical protein MKQ70_02740 [Chitinophaga sedimenti]|uniref:hypothetical protein n=1 Tax=Chitinophaga sedimenti TaxID=2033606 RepID=UPI002003773F|nr:hypothetical protein [Chitinophaga sedimenti]MCK7553981.1 hypothetical protein [Chitinophaga sedimenti]